MKVISSNTPFFLLRFDKGEHVWDKLSTFCRDNDIFAGTFSAIGATDDVMLSFYNLAKKIYEDHHVKNDLEILTITGNISQLDDNYVIHAHGSFGKNDLSVIGGHIKCLIVSATCEVYLHALPGNMERAYDEVTGLNLLK